VGIVSSPPRRVSAADGLGTPEIDMAGEHSSSQAPLRGGWSTDSGHRVRAAGTVSSRAAGEHVAALDSDIRLTLPARPENVAVVMPAMGFA
jgi:hypothetical protein